MHVLLRKVPTFEYSSVSSKFCPAGVCQYQVKTVYYKEILSVHSPHQVLPQLLVVSCASR